MTRPTMTPIVDVFVSLATAWDADAAVLERRGDSRGAGMLKQCADELRAARERRDAEVLTLTEAAQESGYSAETLRKLVRAGAIPQAGRTHAPRIARKDLPRRVGKPASTLYDPQADALRLLARHAS